MNKWSITHYEKFGKIPWVILRSSHTEWEAAKRMMSKIVENRLGRKVEDKFLFGEFNKDFNEELKEGFYTWSDEIFVIDKEDE